MLITLLNDSPEYSKIIAHTLFEEWSAIYIRHSSYKTVELLLDLYIKKNGRDYNMPLTFVAIDEETKAFIGCFTLSSSLFKLYLCDVIVDKSYRNKGYGKKIVNYAIEYAKNEGYPNLYIYLDPDYKLMAFYQTFGFMDDDYIDGFNRKRMILRLIEKKNDYMYLILFVVILCIIFLFFFGY